MCHTGIWYIGFLWDLYDSGDLELIPHHVWALLPPSGHKTHIRNICRNHPTHGDQSRHTETQHALKYTPIQPAASFIYIYNSKVRKSQARDLVYDSLFKTCFNTKTIHKNKLKCREKCTAEIRTEAISARANQTL